MILAPTMGLFSAPQMLQPRRANAEAAMERRSVESYPASEATLFPGLPSIVTAQCHRCWTVMPVSAMHIFLTELGGHPPTYRCNNVDACTERDRQYYMRVNRMVAALNPTLPTIHDEMDGKPNAHNVPCDVCLNGVVERVVDDYALDSGVSYAAINGSSSRAFTELMLDGTELRGRDWLCADCSGVR